MFRVTDLFSSQKAYRKDLKLAFLTAFLTVIQPLKKVQNKDLWTEAQCGLEILLLELASQHTFLDEARLFGR